MHGEAVSLLPSFYPVHDAGTGSINTIRPRKKTGLACCSSSRNLGTNSLILQDTAGYGESPKETSIDRQYWLFWLCFPDILTVIMRPVLVI
jgi:hypothetical protein